MINAQTIQTKRLLLRPFSFDDAPDVVQYANDPEWSKFLPLPMPYTIRDAEEFIARNVLPQSGARPFAIDFKGKAIGGIGLCIEPSPSIASLHYSIGRSYWNRGFMTEAATAITDWGFRTFALEKVYSWADVKNVGSWRVMEKIGMTREGTLRSQGVNRGVRQDFHYYGILRSEWEAKLPSDDVDLRCQHNQKTLR